MSTSLLIAVGGWLASGKSTVSRAIASELGAVRIEADELRATFDRGGRKDAFVPGFSEIVYDEMFTEADKVLGSGRAVVLDGTFRNRARRSHARELAARYAATFRFVECRVDAGRVRERLQQRDDAAGWLVMFEHFLPLWEPVDEIPTEELVVLDTSTPLEASPSRARLRLEPA